MNDNFKRPVNLIIISRVILSDYMSFNEIVIYLGSVTFCDRSALFGKEHLQVLGKEYHKDY
jgi:hypothetical protein